MAASVAAVVLAAGCTAEGRDGTGAPLPQGPVTATVAPRWAPVVTLAGTGDQRTAAFAIDDGAIQWRVTANCAGGRLRVRLADDEATLAEAACPERAFGFAIRTGAVALDVSASGTWRLEVDQQLDRPIDEPALDGMTDATGVARGRIYGIDQRGAGTAVIHQLADGRRALRLDPFSVTANTDLFVWLSEARAPRTSEQALRAVHVQLDRLKSTAGPQNYIVPAEVDLDRIRSVVIWCEPVRTAYAAASLGR